MSGFCIVEGCERPLRSSEMCVMHYQRMMRTGDPLLLKGPRYSVCAICEKQIIRTRKVAVHEVRSHGVKGKRLAYAHGDCWDALIRVIKCQKSA